MLLLSNLLIQALAKFFIVLFTPPTPPHHTHTRPHIHTGSSTAMPPENAQQQQQQRPPPPPPPPPTTMPPPTTPSPSALDALLPVLDTGDLVLFNRRCGAMGPVGAAVCTAAKLYGRYDHLGVVVKEAGTGALMLIDAGFNGVQYVDLQERVRRSKSHDIAVRRLHGVARTPAVRAAMQAYVEEVRGHTYKQSAYQLLASGIVTPAQWRRERLYLEVQRRQGQVRGLKRDLGSKALTPLERGALEKALTEARRARAAALAALEASEVSVFENKEDPGSGLFCSELAAAAYQRLGLLPRYPASNTYIPTDFATSKPPLAVGRMVAALRREGLNLLQGAYLGEEIVVRRRGKDVVVVDGAAAAAEEEEGGGGGEEGAPRRRSSSTTAGEAAPDPVFLARALQKYGPTSGLHPDKDAATALSPTVLGLFKPAVYRDGQQIDTFSSSSSSSSAGGLYVLAEGEVDLYERWQDDDVPSSNDPLPAHDNLLATVGPGTAFGGPVHSSLFPSTVTLHAKARGPVRLWRVEAAAVPALLQRSEPPTRPRTTTEQARVLSVLQHHPYFAVVKGNARVRQEALRRFFLVHVPKGETILAQGERGDNFYILDAGQAQILRDKGGQTGAATASSSSSSFVVSASVSPGAFFGEAAALFNSTRGASVVATKDCRLWALDRLDLMQLTGKGSPYMLDFFTQHASKDRLMTYADFRTTFSPPGHDAPALPLLLRALDPPGTGLVSFSELVHLDVWMNSPSPHIEVALRLANRDTGFQSVTLGDWAALRAAAQRDAWMVAGSSVGGGGGHGQTKEQAAREDEEDARFVAQTFGNAPGAGSRRRKKGWWWGGGKGVDKKNAASPSASPFPTSPHSIPYDDFIAALHSPACPPVVRRYLGAIRAEVNQLRTGWEAMQGRVLLRRAATIMSVQQHDGDAAALLDARQRHDDDDAGGWLAWAKDPQVFGVVVSAGIGGACARLAVAPLERAKILVQTSPRALTLRDALRLMLDPRYARPPWGGWVYQSTRGLLVGNGLNMLRILPVLATQVYLYQYLRDVLQPARPAFPFVSPSSEANTWALTVGPSMPPPPPSSSSSSVSSSSSSSSSTTALPLEAKHMLAGGLAGVAANLLVHPLDTVRARITTQTAASRPYHSAFDCARQIVRKNGGAALWRGSVPCALWAFLYIGINYTCLAMLRPLSQGLLDRKLRKSGGASPSPAATSSVALGSVLVAGAVAQTVAYPFDLLRRRLQLERAERRGGGMWATAKGAVAEGGGLRGLYRGLPILLLKLLPTTVVSYRVSAYVGEWMEEKG